MTKLRSKSDVTEWYKKEFKPCMVADTYTRWFLAVVHN